MADITPPTISITSNKTALKAGDTALITFTLSEVATDFVLSDIAVKGGTLSNFSGYGSAYFATFTPSTASETLGSISVGSYKFSDASGNANEDGGEANNQLTLAIDTKPPTISSSALRTYLGLNESPKVTFTLSEPSTNFDISDISITGGTLSSFNGSGTAYSVVLTPNSVNKLTIRVLSSAFTDLAGNFNHDPSNVITFTPYDPFTANVAWTRILGTNSSDEAYALTTGLDGSIYLSGSTSSSPDGQTNNSGMGAFVAKYNPDGTKIWIRLIATQDYYRASALTTGLDGSIYVSGTKYDGGWDAFITKYNPDGENLWTRVTSTASDINDRALVTGLDGAIYISGGFTRRSIDGETYSGNDDAFIIKYNPDGTKIWTRLLGTSGSEFASALTTGLDGCIYVCGYTTGSLDGQTKSGYQDAFITKYNPDGTKIWTRLLGTSGGYHTYAKALATSIDGSIYMSGYTTGSLDSQAVSVGHDAFVTKFSSEGVKDWTRLFGNESVVFASALTIGPDDSIYVGGTSSGSLDGQGYDNDNDAFIVKLKVLDTSKPTISVNSNKSTLNAGESADLSFILSKPSTNFVQTDTTVKGGILSNFQGSGTNYTATFIPSVEGVNDASVSVGSGKFSDALGIFNEDGADANNKITFIVTIPPDTILPIVAITSSTTSLSASQNAKITFTLSEPSTNFTVGDISVSGGTLSNFAGSGTTYTATFTPTANSIANGVVSVANGVFTDFAGNSNTNDSDANNTITLAVDTVVPTIALSSAKSSLIAGDTTTLTFTLSEASTTFTAFDVNVNGGTLSNFTGSGSTYTALFTPTANSTTIGTVSVISGVFTDATGNANLDGSDSNNALTLAVDTVAPTIALSSSKTSLISGETSTLTLTLSESSINFAVGDVSVSGGTISNFSGSGTTYTALFTPTANSTASGTVSVASGLFTDAAGNANADGSDTNNTVALSVDTVVPTIALSASKTSLIAGDTTTLTFTLSEVSTSFVASGVNVAGGTLSNFAGSGTSYTALFTPTANSTTNGTVSVASGVFADAAGNTNTDGSDTNNTITLAVDNVVPTIALSSTKTSLIAGDNTTLKFTLSEASTTFTASDVTVSGGLLSNFTGSGTSYTALFTPTSNSTTSPTVSVASGTFTDSVGNANADGSDTNNTITLAVDTVVPTIALSSSKTSLIAGDTTNLTFTLSEASTTFTASDVTVTGGALSNFAGSGATYTALFTPTANSTTNATASIASGVFTDTAGNANADGSDANNLLTLAVDTLIPTIAVSSNKLSLQSGDSANLTFTLSEASTSFVGADVVVTGGTLSNFAGSGNFYTATFTLVSNSALNGAISVTNGSFTDAAGNKNADGSDANNSVNFSRIPTITNETHTLSVIVDKSVLGADAVLLKGLKESMTFTNGAITKHIIEYAGSTFDYDQIDSLITTVIRDDEFTAEFTKEINDYLNYELNIPFAVAVKLVGTASIDSVLLSVAGDDGKFVG
jgi:hypothetical protein